jgi:KTSC domain
MFDWVPAASGRIGYYAFDAESGTIAVLFNNNVQWCYSNCTQQMWEEFQLAPSKNGYIREVLDHQQHGPC